MTGATMSLQVANGPGFPHDWVSWAIAGSADNLYGDWRYLNSLYSPPSVGVASATVMMPAPTANGAYEARFLQDERNVVLARVAFTVKDSASPPPPPPPSLAQPVVTVTPSTPMVPDTTPRGAVVATYAVAMDDGSPFNGTVQFGAPNYDAGGIFALSGNSIIVNPTGPGVGPNMNTITDHVTLQATQ
jgi:hypothetical protein